MTSPQKLLAIASSQIGYIETPVNITKYNEWYGIQGIQWCNTFVSWVMDKAGLPELHGIQHPKGSAYCPFTMDFYKKNGRWSRFPKPGSIVFFCWRGDGIADHIGFVEKVLGQEEIVTIEGNTSKSDSSNGGMVMRRSDRIMSNILGYGLPLFTNQIQDHNLSDLSYEELGKPVLYLTSPIMNGPIVELLQNKLFKLGYDIGSAGVDGYFGEKTSEALRSFQKAIWPISLLSGT